MSNSLLRIWLAPFIALGLAWPQATPPDAEEPVSESPAPIERTLASEILEHPGHFLGKEVVLAVQFHSDVESWNPFLTRFGSGRYSCIAAWTDEQAPWLESDFRSPSLRLFARHKSAAEWALEGSESYERFEATCVVRSVFGRKPWLEVVAVRPLLRQLDDGAVLHATRAVDAMRKRDWHHARREFERALAGALPPVSRRELERLDQICRERIPVHEL